MDPILRFDVKSESFLDCIRRRLRPHLQTECVSATARPDDADGQPSWAPPLEAFCFHGNEARERHFWATVTSGDRVVAQVVVKSDSGFALTLIRNESQLLSDLCIKATLQTTREVIDVKDFVVVAVVHVLATEKRLICQFVAKTEQNSGSLTQFANISYNNCVKSLVEFRNSFVLKEKSFSSLLFPKSHEKLTKSHETVPKEEIEVKEKKSQHKRRARRSSSSSSSADSTTSSTTTTTSTTSSSSSTSSERRRRRRQKKRKKDKKEYKKVEKSSKKISFRMSSSKKSASKVSPNIPGFESSKDDRKDDKKRLSDRMRRQLERDAEIERKIYLMSKTVQKFK